MCGIAGILTSDRSEPSPERLQRLSTAIAHRGPDGVGIWSSGGVGLVHRRLAIIDLSTEANQPMHDRLGGLTIVFNGEIYNYRELRKELETAGASFKTQSDTEVILEGYRAWGVECVKRLRGMFAFVLWDDEASRAFIARDRIGKKPLFYTTATDGSLVFASELKALASATSLEVDWEAIRLFFGLQYVPTPRTGFKNVSQLPIGSYAIWEKGSFTIETYHRYEQNRIKSEMTLSEATEGIRARLDEAVRIRQMAADVPVGAFLSGGVDSAAVVAFASKHVQTPLQTFTMGFSSPDMDERKEAQELADAFGTTHHEFEAKPENLVSVADELIRHYDAPYADSSALPLWLLAQQTAKEVKVVLTGDGGDELFGGYRRYVAYDRASQLASIPLLPRIAAPMSLYFGNVFGDVRFGRMASLVEAMRKSSRRAYGELFCGGYFSTASLRELLHPDFFEQTASSDAVSFVSSLMPDASLSSAMFFDLTSYLPDDLNVKMDRATMRWGLEARSPFLDQELVEFALTIPTSLKVARGETKVALKAALKGIVPETVLHRKKKGFQVPLAEWFRGPLKSVLRERVLDSEGPLANIVRLEVVERLVAENESGVDHGNRLWMLFSLATWLAQYE